MLIFGSYLLFFALFLEILHEVTSHFHLIAVQIMFQKMICFITIIGDVGLNMPSADLNFSSPEMALTGKGDLPSGGIDLGIDSGEYS